MSDLFRKEAVLHATRRLSGAVVLATPLSMRVLGLLFVGIVIAAVVFASLATYARKATVTGWLVPDQGMIRAIASAGGFVQALAVMEGDLVEKGATIAELQIAAVTAAGNVGEIIIQQLRAEIEATRARTEARIRGLDSEARQVSVRLENLRAELRQLQTQADLQEQRLAIARQELERGEELAARGNLPRAEVDRRRSAVLAAEQELANLRRQIGAMERDMSDITARIAAIGTEKDAIRAESRSAEASLEQRITDAEARRVQLVTTPVAGRVAALPATVGQPVAAGGTVAIIIPEGAKLEAELLAPSRGAGFIRPGQEVRLMLQAFPHQRFGTVTGEIKAISRTVLGPNDFSIPGLSIQEPIFRVRVALNRDAIYAYGEAIPLQPGMLLSADIVFDRRSLIQWLFDPLFAIARRT